MSKYLSAAEQIRRAHDRFDTLAVGDRVDVHRYGKVYRGRVVSIGRTRVKVEFTYGNGAERTVFLTWHDF